MRSTRSKRLLTGLWCAIVAAAMIALTLHPMRQRNPPPASPHKVRVAAVALRDHVIPFQKYGTKLFMEPLLRQSYDEVYYITQDFRGDKRHAFQHHLRDALERYDQVDLFLAAHGNTFVDWVKPLPPQLKSKLRLVYNTGCANAYQARQWRAQGVRAYVGHPGQMSASPVFLVFFLRAWTHGVPLHKAVQESNASASRHLAIYTRRYPTLAGLQTIAQLTLATANGPEALTIYSGPSHPSPRPL